MIGVTGRPYQQPGSVGRFFAWFTLGISLILIIAYFYFWNSNGRQTPLNLPLVGVVAFPLAGAIIISRNPRNRTGWIAAAMGVSFLITEAGSEYALYALVTKPGSLPFGEILSWVVTWSWTTAYPFLTALFLLFPTGRTTSRIWWLVIAGGVLTTLPVMISNMMLTWEYRGVPILINDLTPATSNLLQQAERNYLTWVPFQVMFITLALLGMIFRFTNSQGLERLQLKWIVLASTLVPLSLTISVIADLIKYPLLSIAAEGFNLVSILAFPIAMIIAISRYRLFDIDFIIRRTLVYSLLTLLLGSIYLGAVVVSQNIFTSAFGQQSQVGIVLSTLLIAALFQPVRIKIQSVIDRRFFRQKYDAETTLERFSAGLRDEVNLEDLTDRLTAAVDETVQPSSVALWLVTDQKKKNPQ